jgi:hypothetical protein
VDVIDTPTSDETAGSSPDTSVAVSATVESSPTDTATPLPGDTSAARDAQPLATSEQVTVDPIDEALKALPTTEELSKQAEQGIQYAKALSTFRPIVESHRQLTQQFTPWQPIIEQFTNPAEIQPVLDLSNALFGKTRMSDDGQVVPDTQEFVEMIHKESPHRLDQIIVDGLLTKTLHNGVEDTRLEHLRKHMGWLLPSEVPVGATADQSDLQNIKPEYREVFQKLAPETQEMLINGSELAREQFLQKELSESNRLAAETKATQQKEVQFLQEAQEAGYQAVVEGYGQTLNSIVDDIFKDVSNDKVTLTGNKETDVFLKGLVGAALVNLTDPVKRPLTEQNLGIKIPAELDQRATAYEDALSKAVICEKYGDNAAAKELRRQANAHAQWLKVKGHEIGAQALSNLSKILGFSYETQNNLLGQATRTRPVVTGTPVNPALPNQAKIDMPEAAPFSPEWIEQTSRPFVRS